MRIKLATIVLVVCLGARVAPSRANSPSTQPAVSAAERKLVLVTKSYKVTITLGDDEGNVEDHDVRYEGVSKKTGKSITLKGSSCHTHAADGTPGHFLRYRFESGNITYEVLEGGSLMVVRDQCKVLIDESGEWQE
jgi:hypothetical protein